MEEKFYSMYDDMTKTYEVVEQMMAAVYDEMVSNPSNEQNYRVLQGLGDIALRTLTSQENFVFTYCQDNQIKERMFNRIEEKKEMLRTSLKKDTGKTM